MAVKLNAPVQVGDEITTIAKLADEGRIVFRAIEVAGRKRLGERKMQTVYIAEIKGSEEYWVIGKTAFLSRTGKPLDFGGV